MFELDTFRSQNRTLMLEQIEEYLKTLPDSERWSDFFANSIGKTLLELIAGIAELLIYKLEIRAMDSYLPVAMTKPAIFLLSQMLGYNPNRKKHGEGKVLLTFTFTVDTPFIIEPISFLSNSIPYIMKEGFYVDASPDNRISQVVVDIIQGEWVKKTYSRKENNLKGEKYENLFVEERDFRIDQFEVYVTVDGRPVKLIERTDSSGRDAVFIRTDYKGGIILLFGDGIEGKLLNPNSVVVVTYLRTLGSGGNRHSGGEDLGQHILPQGVVTAKLASGVVGGVDEDDIEKIRYLASRYFESQGLAVTPNGYAAVIMSYPGIISGKAKRIEDGCCEICISAVSQHHTVNPLYTFSEKELISFLAYMDRYKMISTKIHFYPPKPIAIDIRLKAIVPRVHHVGDLTEELKKHIVDAYCYKLGAIFYPSSSLEVLSAKNPEIRRVYVTYIYVESDLDDVEDCSIFLDRVIECDQFFYPRSIEVTLEVEN